MASPTTNGAGAAPLIDPSDERRLRAGRAIVVQYLDEAHATE